MHQQEFTEDKATDLTEGVTKASAMTHAFKLEKILVATDFSPAADRALEYAISLARRYGSKIYLTHVITLDGYPMMAPEVIVSQAEKARRAARQAIYGLADSHRLSGVSYEVVLEEGTLWPTINRMIEKYGVDLVVAGTHSMGHIQKVLLGSNAEEMFRQSLVPILTVGPSAPPEPWFEAEFKHILFATDFGAGAERQAAIALSLAREHRSKLTVLHVATSEEEHAGSDQQTLLRQMKELLPPQADSRCLVDFCLVRGKPAEQILRARTDTHAELIVMGAKTRKSLAGHAPHTVAYDVVRHAECPVLTLKS